MLHIIAWVGVYAVLLLGLGLATRSWRDKTWFKAAFLPATLIALAIQAAASYLCLGGPLRFAPLRNGCRLVTVENRRVPCLAGALYLFVSHIFLYFTFVIGAHTLETAKLIDAHLLELPNLYPMDMLEGRLEVNMAGYLEGLGEFSDAIAAQPIWYGVFIYLFAPVFIQMRLRGREVLWATILILMLGFIVYLIDWMEMGFPMLSRGWWASFFYFPSWWAMFSFYVTTVAVACILFTALRNVGKISRLFSDSQSPKKKSKPKPKSRKREPAHA